MSQRFSIDAIQNHWLTLRGQRWLLLITLLLGAIMVLPGRDSAPVVRAEGPVSLSGRLLDPQGQPVHGAEVLVREGVGDELIAKAESQHDGTFVVDLPAGQFSPPLIIKIDRPHFQSLET